jgi:exodeoxyribonuclease VII large subunit
VDVIVVARGGGAFEDLLPFSSEALVRAAAACVTPVVSAIGHEKDTPLLDLVADVRASTPTDAGKRIVPDAAEESRLVARTLNVIRSAIEARLDREAQALLAQVTRPALVYPERLIDPHAAEVRRVHQAARHAVALGLATLGDVMDGLVVTLQALSPQATLNRGYAVVRNKNGNIVRDAGALNVGDLVAMRFARGAAEGAISSTTRE